MLCFETQILRSLIFAVAKLSQCCALRLTRLPEITIFHSSVSVPYFRVDPPVESSLRPHTLVAEGLESNRVIQYFLGEYQLKSSKHHY